MEKSDFYRLKPCPFCGCAMTLRLRKELIELQGEHESDCFFAGSFDGKLTLSIPAAAGAKSWVVATWNQRAIKSRKRTK